MSCPAEIATVLLEILRYGILGARAAGWEGDAARSAIEADHLHNLPDLLRDYAPERLHYYVTVEVPCYREKVDRHDTALFEPLWDRLDQLLAMTAAHS
jgi:hypothetical protein